MNHLFLWKVILIWFLKNMISKTAASFILFLVFNHVNANVLELDEFTDLPVQFTNQSCQSYAIAVALLQKGFIANAVPIDKYSDITKILSIYERELRSLIVFSKNLRGYNLRDDWDFAIREFTRNKYRLKEHELASELDVFDFVEKHFEGDEICVSVSGKCKMDLFNEKKLSKAILLMSFIDIEHRPFDAGHIVGVAGIEAKKSPVKLRVINSYDQRGVTNTCVQTHGSIGWVDRFQMKIFSDSTRKNKERYFNVALVVENK